MREFKTAYEYLQEVVTNTTFTDWYNSFRAAMVLRDGSSYLDTVIKLEVTDVEEAIECIESVAKNLDSRVRVIYKTSSGVDAEDFRIIVAYASYDPELDLDNYLFLDLQALRIGEGFGILAKGISDSSEILMSIIRPSE